MSGQPDIGKAQEGKIIILKCDDDDSKSLEADLTILAKHSKYFEGCASFPNNEIVFDSKIVSFAALDALIKFLDSSDLKIDKSNVQYLVIASDYLQIDTALDLLMKYLHDDIMHICYRPSEFATMLKSTILLYLRLYSIIRRHEIATGYTYPRANFNILSLVYVMAHNLNMVLHEIHVYQLDEERFHELLVCDYLQLTEETVLKTIKLWINFDLEARKGSFERLVRCVRPDETITTKLIWDELTCHCSGQCNCLTSKDFAFALLFYKLDLNYKEESGPLIWTPRNKSLP